MSREVSKVFGEIGSGSVDMDPVLGRDVSLF